MENKGADGCREYRIMKLRADGYERFATVRAVDTDAEYTVCFLEPGEYLARGELSALREPGDILSGRLFIDLVTKSQAVSARPTHRQPIPGSPHLEAVVENVQTLDDFTILARSTLCEDLILVKFEARTHVPAGERISLEGELRMDLSPTTT